MSRAIRMRIERPERSAPMAEIPAWCDLPEQVPATIDAMIAAGEIRSEERERCVFWERATFALWHTRGDAGPSRLKVPPCLNPN